MISYAQNGEDVVLRRAFAGRDGPGFYVDVGAGHPEDDSVTHHFFERGWRGVNVEPDRDLFDLLTETRGGDTNINAAIGSQRGRAEFVPIGAGGHGSLLAEGSSRRQGDKRVVSVPVMTLADLLDIYGPEGGDIDFLKVDVAGREAKVLEGADWSRHRPVVVVVAAVDDSGAPTHAEWEPGVMAGGYRFALFDGLNRFYCRGEDADSVLPRLASPAGVLDRWTRRAEAAVQAQLALLTAEAAQAAARLAAEVERGDSRYAALAESHAADRAHLQQFVDRAQARCETMGIAAEDARERAARSAAALIDAKADAASLSARLDVIRVELAQARDSAASALRREETAEATLADMELQTQIATEMRSTNEADLQRAISAVHAEEIDKEAHADRAAQAEASLSDHLMQHEAEIGQLRQEYEQLAQWRQAVWASTSWRVTRPLRALVRLAKGGSLRAG